MTQPIDNRELEGFGSQIRDGFKSIHRGACDLSYASVMVFYYWTWIRKERIKRGFRLGSFIVLLFLAALLIVEFSADYYGAPRLAGFLRLTPVSEGIKLALFLAAATFILFHYQSEMKKPEYEFRFVIGILTLMSKLREGTGVNSLQVFHTLFSKADITNVSAYAHQDNQLIKHSVYSEKQTAIFLPELPIKTSVAGKALSDGAARYAPRLFLPNTSKTRGKLGWPLYMPHALRFKFSEVSEQETDGGSVGKNVSFYRMDSSPKVERDVFNWDRNVQFCSILSVPIKLGKDEEGCIGVLNFEFGGAGTLDTVDIAMASVYATWFGREVLRNEGLKPYIPSDI
jgi:hypothetical protein